MIIKLDNRERTLLDGLEHAINDMNIQIEVRKENLTVGDFQIWYGDVPLLIIERKTWKDLASSIKDGRCETQDPNLRELNNIGCTTVMLIEGNLPGYSEKVHGKMMGIHVWGKIRCMILSGLQCIMTRNIQQSIDTIVGFIPNIIDKYKDNMPGASVDGRFIQSIHIPASLSPEFKTDLNELFRKYETSGGKISDLSYSPNKKKRASEKMWKILLGKGKLFRIVLKQYSLRDYFTNPEVLSGIKYDSGRKISAKKISSCLQVKERDTLLKELLLCIDGCSTNRAEELCKQYTMDIVLNTDTILDVYLNNRRIPVTIIKLLREAIDYKYPVCVQKIQE